MTPLPFLNKQHPELPDFYGIHLFYIDGTKETVESVQHKIFMECHLPYLECLKRDDSFICIPLSSLKKFELDKNFTKTIEIQNKINQEIKERHHE